MFDLLFLELVDELLEWSLDQLVNGGGRYLKRIHLDLVVKAAWLVGLGNALSVGMEAGLRRGHHHLFAQGLWEVSNITWDNLLLKILELYLLDLLFLFLLLLDLLFYYFFFIFLKSDLFFFKVQFSVVVITRVLFL